MLALHNTYDCMPDVNLSLPTLLTPRYLTLPDSSFFTSPPDCTFYAHGSKLHSAVTRSIGRSKRFPVATLVNMQRVCPIRARAGIDARVCAVLLMGKAAVVGGSESALETGQSERDVSA